MGLSSSKPSYWNGSQKLDSFIFSMINIMNRGGYKHCSIGKINEKREIKNASIKPNSIRIFKLKLNIEPKKIKVLIISINPPKVINVNFEAYDLFLNDS